MKIIPLSEGSFTIDKTKQFVPFEVGEDDLQSRPMGSLLVEVQPFVIVTEKDVLLLDTGLGFAGEDGKMQLLTNLIKAGIQPSSITKVILSHLHKDHAGGISEEKERKKMTFPDAKYYVQRRELDSALKKGFPSYLTAEFDLLKESANVVFLEDDKGTIDGYIDYEVTGAHSPFHQVIWIREGTQKIFFGADDAPQLHQMMHRFIPKYDYDGRKAMELRREWWDRGAKEKWTFLFYHDIKTPVQTG